MRKRFLASSGAAALLVLAFTPAAHAADQTVIDTAPDGPIAVDLLSPTGADEITRRFDVTAAGLVTKVTVTVDFMASRSDSCADDLEWTYSYADELDLVLISPTLTEVPLVFSTSTANQATYDSEYEAESRVQVTFDDDALDVVGTVNDQYPTSGVFKPVGALATLNGEVAAGSWTLRISDADGGAAQCYYGATLSVVTDAVDVSVAPTAPAKVETAAR